MSTYGQWVTVTISSGSTTSSAVDLGREYDYLSIQIPAMDQCKLYLKVSDRVGGTYYDLGKETTTDEETFNRADVWRLGGWRFIKIASTVEQNETRTLRVCGMRY